MVLNIIHTTIVQELSTYRLAIQCEPVLSSQLTTSLPKDLSTFVSRGHFCTTTDH